MLLSCSVCFCFFMSYYVSLRSEFGVVISVTISAWKRCSVRLYLQLFVVEVMSYLRYLCLFPYSGVKHILCYVFVFFFSVLCILRCLFFLDCPYLIASSVFSNVYVSLNCLLPAFVIVYLICYLTLNTSAHTSYLYVCQTFWPRTTYNICTF